MKYIERLMKIVEMPSYYSLLAAKLNSVPFIPKMAMDENRADDGLMLRDRYGSNSRQPCSILEMMVALAYRCEKNIMLDDEYGDRTSEWFTHMLLSLGIEGMSNEDYDEDYVDFVLTKFLDRKYSKNGKGGLFTTDDKAVDMRKLEIWSQMHKFLEDK